MRLDIVLTELRKLRFSSSLGIYFIISSLTTKTFLHVSSLSLFLDFGTHIYIYLKSYFGLRENNDQDLNLTRLNTF